MDNHLAQRKVPTEPPVDDRLSSCAFPGGDRLDMHELLNLLPKDPHRVVIRNFDNETAKLAVDDVHEAVMFGDVLSVKPAQDEHTIRPYGPIPLVAEAETEQTVKTGGGVALYVPPASPLSPILDCSSQLYDPKKLVVADDVHALAKSGDFGLVLDLSRTGATPDFHLEMFAAAGGNPLPERCEEPRSVDHLLEKINHFEALRFGEWLQKDVDVDQFELLPMSSKPMHMLRCHAAMGSTVKASPECIIMRPEVVGDIADLAHSRVVPAAPHENIWHPKQGLVKDYKEKDIWERLARPGSRLAILEQDGHVLGYCLYFIDSESLPKQGRALRDALEESGEAPRGKVGYANLVEVTPWGRKFAKEYGVSIYQKLLNAMLEDAHEAGLQHMLGEVRLLPFPNSSASSKHSEHGWVESNTALLSPIGEEGGRVKYFLAKVISLAVPDKSPRVVVEHA